MQFMPHWEFVCRDVLLLLHWRSSSPCALGFVYAQPLKLPSRAYVSHLDGCARSACWAC